MPLNISYDHVKNDKYIKYIQSFINDAINNHHNITYFSFNTLSLFRQCNFSYYLTIHKLKKNHTAYIANKAVSPIFDHIQRSFIIIHNNPKQHFQLKKADEIITIPYNTFQNIKPIQILYHEWLVSKTDKNRPLIQEAFNKDQNKENAYKLFSILFMLIDMQTT